MSDFKIGDKVIAKRTLRYFMGQIPSDKICRGEECTVDYVDEKRQMLGFEEHADRYGPWPMEDFKLKQSICKYNSSTPLTNLNR